MKKMAKLGPLRSVTQCFSILSGYSLKTSFFTNVFVAALRKVNGKQVSWKCLLIWKILFLNEVKGEV